MCAESSIARAVQRGLEGLLTPPLHNTMPKVLKGFARQEAAMRCTKLVSAPGEMPFTKHTWLTHHDGGSPPPPSLRWAPQS